MKNVSKKCQKNDVFFDFSNHAGAQVPIFTPNMKKLEFARLACLARPARLITRKWDFRRRSRPRELAQRSQDDVSLNKFPQINIPQTELGSVGVLTGLLKGLERSTAPRAVNFDQEKSVLGDTCCFPVISAEAVLQHRFLLLPTSCLLYTSPSPRDVEESRMPSSA